MPNDLFRNKVITRINAAISEYRDASGIEHRALQGRIREIALDNLFRPLLPSGIEIGTGKILDNCGIQSHETDLIIYSKAVLPAIMYSEREGLFPAEACCYAIEVKSRATATEIKDALAKAESLRNLRYAAGLYDIQDVPINHPIKPVIPAFFAFTTELAENGKSELERYSEIDPHFREAPCLVAICVVGRGYWWWRRDKKWIFHPPTPDHDEIIDFLSGVINTIPDSLVARGHPRLGNYLIQANRGTIVG